MSPLPSDCLRFFLDYVGVWEVEDSGDISGALPMTGVLLSWRALSMSLIIFSRFLFLLYTCCCWVQFVNESIC